MIALSALPVVAIGAAAYYSAEHALTHQISDDDLEQSLAIRLAIEGYINERVHDVMALAATDLLSEARASTSAKATALAGFLSVYRMYRAASIWDDAGKMVAQSGGTDSSGQYIAQALKTGGTMAFAEFSPSLGRMVVHLVSPIKEPGQWTSGRRGQCRFTGEGDLEISPGVEYH